MKPYLAFHHMHVGDRVKCVYQRDGRFHNGRFHNRYHKTGTITALRSPKGNPLIFVRWDDGVETLPFGCPNHFVPYTLEEQQREAHANKYL